MKPIIRALCGLSLLLALDASPALDDETSQSPYMAKITGQEDYVYVWTLGVEGLGDGSDKLVTVDVRPDSSTYGKVVACMAVDESDEILMITAKGKLIRFQVEGVSKMGRATQGVRLLTVDEGDVVASAIRTEEEAPEATEGAEGETPNNEEGDQEQS